MPLTTVDPGVAHRLRAAESTYREAGHTAGALPPGYHPAGHILVSLPAHPAGTARADERAG